MTITRTNLTDEMENLRSEILSMATRVEGDLRKAREALLEGNIELAEKVKADDRTVNAMQENIQYLAAILMATQQPVAQDLRELVSAIRLADNLERMGDYSVHLAKTAIKLKGSSWPRQFEILDKMAEAGSRMIHLMIEAYLAKDVERAEACSKLDTEVDDLHHELISITLVTLRQNTAQADEAVKLIRTSGFLERLADHVTNSCELVSYIITGKQTEFND